MSTNAVDLFDTDAPATPVKKVPPRVAELSAELNAMLAEPEPAPAPEPVVIPEPGIYPDLTMEEYLAIPVMSASKLEKLLRSPLQLRHSLTEPPKRTAALDRGTALHLAVLEPLFFEGRYVTIGQCEGLKKDKDRCTYQGCVYRDGQSFCKTHDPEKGADMDPEIEVLTESDYAAVLGMRDAINAQPRARSLFEGKGAFETTIIWQDEATGVMCKARPDRLVERAGMLVDVKTSRSASPRDFPRLAENLGYFSKLAWYRRGLRALGWPYEVAVVLAIEPCAPYDLAPYLVDEPSLDSADGETDRLLRVFRQCTEANVWPGYAESADGFLTLERPAWASGRAE